MEIFLHAVVLAHLVPGRRRRGQRRLSERAAAEIRGAMRVLMVIDGHSFENRF